jgi:two-component sensor histidine kinase
VYGLQVGANGPLDVASLLQAIAQSAQRTFGRPITVTVEGAVPHRLPEAESIPVALTVNELFTNAIKHSGGADVRASLSARGDTVLIRIASHAVLPEGFDLLQVRAGVSGLGLVRALLPRRSATLTLVQDGDDVVASIELRPPGVRLPEPLGTADAALAAVAAA